MKGIHPELSGDFRGIVLFIKFLPPVSIPVFFIFGRPVPLAT
jgi:hypothetical protein